ncbi:aldo/keto reductase [Rhizobium sp. 16-449-1b]|nr:aldo/keto reductase [Rhizobium sp. 16-449-1b]
MLPIPGTSNVKHIEQNVAAADLILSEEDFTALDREGRVAFDQASG